MTASPFHAFERFGDFNIAVADDLAVAAVQSDLVVSDLGDHAEAVIFILEDPAGIVERTIGQSGKHRLKPLRQRGSPAHACEAFSRTLRNVME
jgi:hypothetical protein